MPWVAFRRNMEKEKGKYTALAAQAFLHRQKSIQKR
jgi:hypothetical protein